MTAEQLARVQWYMDNGLAFAYNEFHLLMWIVGAAIFMLFVIRWQSRKKVVKVPADGETTMSKSDYRTSRSLRKNVVRSMIADDVAAMLLNRFTKGDITEDEYKVLHIRFGVDYNLPDLLPQKLKPEHLKVAIKHRLSSGMYKHASIPGPKPGEQEKPAGKKSLLQQIFEKHKAA